VAAAAPDRDQRRGLYSDLRPRLRALRIGAVRLPGQDGQRLPLIDFFELVEELAAADSNLAHFLRNHYAAVENNLLAPTASSPRLLALAAGGALFGGAAQERTGSTSTSETKFQRQADGSFMLNTRRYYATGSIYADYLQLRVDLEDESQQGLLIESDRAGVSIPDDWQGFGQRLTGSGSIELNDVRITKDDFVDSERSAKRYPFTFSQLYLTTVIAGIARRALADALGLVAERSRNYYHGSTEQVADEPIVQAAIGLASAKSFAADAVIAAAARELERSFAEPADQQLSLAATVAASQAKITVESLALEVVDLMTQVGSGSTLNSERALDRHWRNLKVLAGHNPAGYKQRTLGAYLLTGTPPPHGAYF
jgi:alkylation response protein AidB-like acyl-CoA dehydrogenase